MAEKLKYTTSEVWAERYKLASGQQTKLFKRFSNWYDSLYTVMGTVPAPWRSKVYVPVLARQTWALVSKFLAIKPGFQVRVSSPEEGSDDIDDKAEKAQRKLEYDYENPYLDNTMRDKLFAPLLDAVVTGTGIAKVEWCVDEDYKYEREIDDEGNVDLSTEKKTTKKVTYNNLEPVNIFNVFVSPSATDLYNAPWIIIKETKTLDELKAKGIYKNLDQISGSESYDDEFTAYNFSRNRLTSSQNRRDNTVGNVKIYECYEGKKIQTFAESQSTQSGNDGGSSSGSNWILLLERPNPYWFGKYPLVKFHVKKRPFDFWGEGIFETTFRLQSAYNDVYNHFLDQWNLAENSMLMVKENSNVNEYIVEPGGTITYRGEQPPTQFKHAMPDPRAMETILSQLDSAVEGVTISQYAAGLPNDQTDKTKGTATGIVKLQEAAGDTVSFMRQNFTEAIVQIGRMWLSNNQQFMDQPVNMVVTKNGQKQNITVTPKDMQGDMELIIDDSTMDPSSQDDKITRELAYMQQIQQLQQASVQQAQLTRWVTPPLYFNYANLFNDYSNSMGRSQSDKYLVAGNEVEQAMKQSQSPFITPNERMNIDINQLYGSEAAQWLQRNGIQPDPQRAQQQPTPGDAFQASETGVNGQTQDPTQVTPDHILQAQQQTAKQQLDAAKLAHQQQKDAAQLALQAHDQQFNQLHQAAQFQQQVNEPNPVQKVVNKVRGKK